MKFMAMCSSGLGSSLMVHMNIEKALKTIGAKAEVDHTDLGSASPNMADVFVIGRDLENSVAGFKNVIVLDSIIDQRELTEKIRRACDQHGIPSQN